MLNYSLISDPSGCFAINPSTGVTSVASALNFEATPAWPLTVRVADQNGHVYDQPFTINVTGVNEAPLDATFPGSSVAENSANGTVVGKVTGLRTKTRRRMSRSPCRRASHGIGDLQRRRAGRRQPRAGSRARLQR